MGATAALGRARRFAIMVVTHVNHQIRPCIRGRGNDFRKRPSGRIVAVLHHIPVESAAGVAEHQDTLRIWPRERQCSTVERCCHRSLRHRHLAAAHRKYGRLNVLDLMPGFGANAHRRRHAVKDRLRTEVVGDRAHARGAVRPEFDPPGNYARLGSQRWQENHDREIGSNGKARADDGSEMADMRHWHKTFGQDAISRQRGAVTTLRRQSKINESNACHAPL